MNKIIKRDGEIIHYGVIGMRWGIRKDRGSSGNRTSNHMKRSVNQKYGRRNTDHMKRSINQKYGKEISNVKKSANQKYGKEIANIKKSFNQKYGNLKTITDNLSRLSPAQKTFIANLIGTTMLVSGATLRYLADKNKVDFFIYSLFHK